MAPAARGRRRDRRRARLALVRDDRPRWALRPGPRRRSPPPSRPAPTRPRPALAFALGAVLAGDRGPPGLGGRAAAAAAFWRPDVGAIAALAAAATLLVAARRRPPGRRGDSRLAPARPRRGAPPAPSRRRVAARGASRVAASSPARALVLYAPFLVAAGPGDGLGCARRPGHAGRGVVAVAVPGRVRRRGREGLPDVAAAPYAALVVLALAAFRSGGPCGLVILGARRGDLLRLAGRPRARAGAAGGHRGARGARSGRSSSAPPCSRCCSRSGRRTAPARCSGRRT